MDVEARGVRVYCRSAKFFAPYMASIPLAGLRSARGMLPAAGLDFGDLAHALIAGSAIPADMTRARLEEKRDLTMRALAAELARRGIVVTHDTVWRFVRSLGLSLKKTLTAKEQDGARVVRLRHRWKPYAHRGRLQILCTLVVSALPGRGLWLEADGRAPEADGNSVEFRRMCHYMMRAALEATRRAKAEEAGDFAYETKDPLFKEPLPAAPAPQPQSVPVQLQPTVTPAVSGPTIETLVEPFVAEKEAGGIGSKTLADYRATLALFTQVVGGDRPVAAISGDEVVTFKNLLCKCPTNFRKRLGTDDLREAIKRNDELPKAKRLDTLAPKTINEKYLPPRGPDAVSAARAKGQQNHCLIPTTNM